MMLIRIADVYKRQQGAVSLITTRLMAQFALAAEGSQRRLRRVLRKFNNPQNLTYNIANNRMNWATS